MWIRPIYVWIKWRSDMKFLITNITFTDADRIYFLLILISKFVP